MPWTYSQSTGQLWRNGILIGVGYSGAGTTAASGRNNPLMQNIPEHGPIPSGQYQIGNAYHHPAKGPTSMNIAPVGHNALGRTGFMIHGNNQQNNASKGCVIMAPNIRQQIATSNDHDLIVQP
jgi:hypothetical protein